ncbi:uncharacterized protein MKK02DRAFT_31132 [Dioszegia hungarica]|uniref:Uncharacterized protein n=1 Tax=Dioszegia hungarica TaxID=4972 RepID=A0AA38LXM5_9TREE|nr:uncharacterized protein MKK02DRAFT_31132 [Dioszegia hungarica]KAI9638818.1 hypothetical protein MKK02DRAFT_31132 [Dioszegia hungarica]
MRRSGFFSVSMALLWSASLALAQNSPLKDHGALFGKACSTQNQRYDQNTFNLITDCDAQTYCAANNTCAYRGCRKDIFPYGYNYVPFEQLPPLCPQGSFCPDESDRCLDAIEIGKTCQKDRDGELPVVRPLQCREKLTSSDECQQAPNYRDLANYLNVNGSICLKNTCYLANVSVGQTCINDNTRYTAYNDQGSEYAIIVSRDNCATSLYCDGTSLQCIRSKTRGTECSGNKECLSYNCENGICGKAADEPVKPPVYSYVLIGIGIVGLIVGVIVTLWFVHRRTRNENQRKLEQYWNEQMAYRQSIMSMYQAKSALLDPNHDPNDQRPRSMYNGPLGGRPEDGGLTPPPALRRDSSVTWSEEGSEVLLVPGSGGTPGPGERRCVHLAVPNAYAHVAGRQPASTLNAPASSLSSPSSIQGIAHPQVHADFTGNKAVVDAQITACTAS